MLEYKSYGEGTPIVILHGLYGSADNWLQIARKLSADFKVILPDLRNHGSSPHESTHRYEDMVADLAWLFHELEIEKAHILGHSMGGKVAIAFAADYPERVLSLVVADIAPRNYLKDPASDLQYSFHKNILLTLAKLDLTQFKNLNEIEKQLKQGIPETTVRKFMLKNLSRDHKKFSWKINVAVLQEYLEEIIGGVDISEFNDRIPIYKYPVLFIKGELSKYIQDKDKSLILRMYPEAEFIEMKDASHLLHAEKPKEFTEIILKYLKSQHI